MVPTKTTMHKKFPKGRIIKSYEVFNKGKPEERQRQRWPSLSFDKRCFFFDLGNPLLNRIAKSFIKAAGVTSP
ncbi:outer envelope pore protein 16-2, chloroplastic [Senna tora]|uniref:Outer envelope pore protein 16-2, chloroplastic n=1 Tax=Senna tora TaxID=362788 RepID=A0A834SF91_9FABA|nr:outer envelope pore protein 16-2, chloroplastic [Senna tora]